MPISKGLYWKSFRQIHLETPETFCLSRPSEKQSRRNAVSKDNFVNKVIPCLVKFKYEFEIKSHDSFIWALAGRKNFLSSSVYKQKFRSKKQSLAKTPDTVWVPVVVSNFKNKWGNWDVVFLFSGLLSKWNTEDHIWVTLVPETVPNPLWLYLLTFPYPFLLETATN